MNIEMNTLKNYRFNCRAILAIIGFIGLSTVHGFGQPSDPCVSNTACASFQPSCPVVDNVVLNSATASGITCTYEFLVTFTRGSADNASIRTTFVDVLNLPDTTLTVTSMTMNVPNGPGGALAGNCGCILVNSTTADGSNSDIGTATIIVTGPTPCLNESDINMEWEAMRNGSCGGGNCGNCGMIEPEPLPVDLIKFDAINNFNNVILSWSTASEVNNSHFELEARQENSNWSRIGSVEGNGSTTSLNKYSFAYKTEQSGIYYFRMKQIDFDGKAAYSSVKSVRIKSINDSKIIEYAPNPVENSLYIYFDSRAAKTYMLQLHDMSGRLIRELDINGSDQISLSDLSHGLFTITLLEQNKVIDRQKLIKI